MRSFRNYNNVISICGAGRNVGKTFLGESIISHFAKNNDIIAIKISKFKHSESDKVELKIIFKSTNYTIYKELNFTSKDSGRYLKAGAKNSYYIECDDANLLNAFLYVYNLHDESVFFICESASITKYIKPALSIFVEAEHFPTEKNKLLCLNRSSLVLKERSIEIMMPQLFLTVKKSKWLSKYLVLENCEV
ncbi:MAG: hypothetical protein JJE44_07005 [Flavobacteriaceae bacterium]|nr:hypothetical protein [Flavobacteriaceae bacterium]